MTGPDTETLTAALRRLADEHASGLLSVATPGRDVVLELADGVPVGIGPPQDVSERVGRDANAELVAVAVIDGLVDRTVAAIVGGGGEWVWDVSDSATMMPVPPDLATELSRRAVDAAQALAMIAPDQVLVAARDLETHGELDRVRRLFDGDRTVAEVAEAAGLTVPATATLAAALVSAGVLSTGQEDVTSRSWTDAVASGSSIEDDEEDEPELWVMDPPDEEEVEEDATEATEARTVPTPTEARTGTPETSVTEADEPEPAEPEPASSEPASSEPTVPEPVASEPTMAEPAAFEAAVADLEPTAADQPPQADESDTGWADTTWLDELGASDRRAAAAAVDDDGGSDGADSRAALSAMISDLQDQGQSPAPDPREPADRRREPPEQGDQRHGPRQEDAGGEDPAEQPASSEAKRKEPKAAPGEVAEFLRELSRLALDDE